MSNIHLWSMILSYLSVYDILNNNDTIKTLDMGCLYIISSLVNMILYWKLKFNAWYMVQHWNWGLVSFLSLSLRVEVHDLFSWFQMLYMVMTTFVVFPFQKDYCTKLLFRNACFVGGVIFYFYQIRTCNN